MAFIDGSVVTIALPVIQSDFDATFRELQWVVNAYTLMLGSLILVAGALGDRVGRRRIFAIGITVFALASLACAVATGSTMLIAARALQGAGAALLVPQSLAIISASFPRETRGRAIGFWAAASAVTTALGPPLGGFLIDTLSWRVAFLINLPLSVVALWLTIAYLPESRNERVSGPLDWAGSALAIVSLGALTYALTEFSEESSGGRMALMALVAGCVALGAFLYAEARAKNPILPAALFSSRAFVVANVLTIFLYGALAGILFLLPFDLIARRGMAASAVGMTLIPFGLIIGLLSRWSGMLSDRYGARNFLVGGSLTVAIGAAWMALMIEDFWLGVFAPLIAMALGMAAVVTPLTTVVMNSAPDAQSGTASGINNAASRVASLFAVAVLGTIAGLIFSWKGAPSRAHFGELPTVGNEMSDALEQAFVAAYSGAMAVAAIWSVLAAASAFFWLTAKDCAAKPEQALAS
jgi:EmrB/QacA subfamily drug resistance transporter